VWYVVRNKTRKKLSKKNKQHDHHYLSSPAESSEAATTARSVQARVRLTRSMETSDFITGDMTVTFIIQQDEEEAGI